MHTHATYKRNRKRSFAGTHHTHTHIRPHVLTHLAANRMCARTVAVEIFQQNIENRFNVTVWARTGHSRHSHLILSVHFLKWRAAFAFRHLVLVGIFVSTGLPTSSQLKMLKLTSYTCAVSDLAIQKQKVKKTTFRNGVCRRRLFGRRKRREKEKWQQKWRRKNKTYDDEQLKISKFIILWSPKWRDESDSSLQFFRSVHSSLPYTHTHTHRIFDLYLFFCCCSFHSFFFRISSFEFALVVWSPEKIYSLYI